MERIKDWLEIAGDLIEDSALRRALSSHRLSQAQMNRTTEADRQISADKARAMPKINRGNDLLCSALLNNDIDPRAKNNSEVLKFRPVDKMA